MNTYRGPLTQEDKAKLRAAIMAAVTEASRNIAVRLGLQARAKQSIQEYGMPAIVADGLH